ncbi:PREDICTED: uncharacterized protein LOC109217127 [Nicotiana attenuata]|uniref:Uncharacterized protein n=1 Tax=Nicotiana attenuata TaxID=49451 RepID=A0A1J6KCW1_NICAT|nr:PREDICTED: uncharacterized protein LOC109217127 [Nicotiana attenuata]OIT22784.1 hypothetical protein A4A49_29833 [Nicotiana attenuata]
MAISDRVVGNLTTLYLLVIAAMKAYGLMTGRSYGGGFVLIVSTTVVGIILILSLTYDVSRKARYALTRNRNLHHHHPTQQLYQPRHHSDELCRGGICWHGVADRSPASQVRFRLPQHLQPR